MSAPILVMAGGTGGHVFPALAVARALRERDEKVIWLGTAKGLESRVVPANDFPLELVRVAGLRRKGLVSWLFAPFKLLLAIWDALRIVYRVKPKAVLGMGGFASGPGGFAAWLLRKPLVIHEQNAAAGLTNRLSATMAKEVLQGFPDAFNGKVAARTIGNPVREDIFSIPAPAERLSVESDELRVLVLGGSQGALVLNQTVPLAVKLLQGAHEISVWHQSGPSTLERAEQAYKEASVEARIESFIEDMKSAYAWADIVVCRAGALTIAEIAAAGLGSVLVPYPSAVDDHQTRNGMFMVNAGAAVLIPQPEFNAERLAQELSAVASDRKRLLEMAEAARSQAKPDATNELMNACLQAAGGAA